MGPSHMLPPEIRRRSICSRCHVPDNGQFSYALFYVLFHLSSKPEQRDIRLQYLKHNIVTIFLQTLGVLDLFYFVYGNFHYPFQGGIRMKCNL